MTTFFDHDDDGYQAWLSGHPRGFVGNMTRSKTPTYFTVHRATCSTITPGSSRSNRPGAFTARDYRKVCSTDLEVLQAWADQEGFAAGSIHLCRKCYADGLLPARAGRLYPDEVPSTSPAVHREGAVRRVVVNAYERSAAARRVCLAVHGYDCVVCGFDFRRSYGELGEGFIHVHHLEELSRVGDDYQVDPVEDLRPVCPNCHAMLHRETPALSIEQLRSRLSRGSVGWPAPPLGSGIEDEVLAELQRYEEAKDLVGDRAFSEGGLVMLFARLRRAVTNQLNAGDATASRYGNWAMTCRDHIGGAMASYADGDVEKANRLLRLAGNSLSAFAAVQRSLEPRG